MATNDKLTDRDFDVIKQHAGRLIAACDDNLLQLRSISPVYRDDSYDNRVNYWKHARAALKWCVETARQRKHNNV